MVSSGIIKGCSHITIEERTHHDKSNFSCVKLRGLKVEATIAAQITENLTTRTIVKLKQNETEMVSVNVSLSELFTWGNIKVTYQHIQTLFVFPFLQ